MTDLGLLSHQYQEFAELARRLRQEAAAIKFAFYDLPESESPEPKVELTLAMRELAQVSEFLRDVIDVKDEGKWPEHWLAAPPIPSVIVERLRDAHENDRPLYRKKIEVLTQHLNGSVAELTEQDMSLIDEIVVAANADATAVFRRLMRWG